MASFSEEQFVAWLKANTKMSHHSRAKGFTGIGDDAAVIPLADSFLVLTTDAIAEDVHFKREWSAPEDIGWKTMAVNVSDMAAMGVAPQWALVTAGIPDVTGVAYLKAVHRGLADCASHYGCVIAGGDTVKANKWFINVAMGGITKKPPILRSGAREGDFIFVTGTLGNSACALELLRRKSKKYPALLQFHKKPRPRLKEGIALMDTKCVSSMMDVSDGLSKDLARLLKESHAGAKLFKHQIPVSTQVVKAAAALKKSPYDFALHGGEDYELLFTVGGEKLSLFYEAYHKILPAENMPLLIGEITADKQNRIVLIDNEKTSILQSSGYDHLLSLKS